MTLSENIFSQLPPSQIGTAISGQADIFYENKRKIYSHQNRMVNDQ